MIVHGYRFEVMLISASKHRCEPNVKEYVLYLFVVLYVSIFQTTIIGKLLIEVFVLENVFSYQLCDNEQLTYPFVSMTSLCVSLNSIRVEIKMVYLSDCDSLSRF